MGCVVVGIEWLGGELLRCVGIDLEWSMLQYPGIVVRGVKGGVRVESYILGHVPWRSPCTKGLGPWAYVPGPCKHLVSLAQGEDFVEE